MQEAEKHAQVVVEIEVGENRSGIIEEDKFFELLDSIKRQKTYFLGIFSHEGHCYNAETREDCHEKFIVSQNVPFILPNWQKERGMECKRVSIGSTKPSVSFRCSFRELQNSALEPIS